MTHQSSLFLTLIFILIIPLWATINFSSNINKNILLIRLWMFQKTSLCQGDLQAKPRKAQTAMKVIITFLPSVFSISSCQSLSSYLVLNYLKGNMIHCIVMIRSCLNIVWVCMFLYMLILWNHKWWKLIVCMKSI